MLLDLLRLLREGDAPLETSKEFISYAKANPGKVRWETQGWNQLPYFHLGMNVTGCKLQPSYPLRGSGPASRPLGGHVDDGERISRSPSLCRG